MGGITYDCSICKERDLSIYRPHHCRPNVLRSIDAADTQAWERIENPDCELPHESFRIETGFEMLAGIEDGVPDELETFLRQHRGFRQL